MTSCSNRMVVPTANKFSQCSVNSRKERRNEGPTGDVHLMGLKFHFVTRNKTFYKKELSHTYAYLSISVQFVGYEH